MKNLSDEDKGKIAEDITSLYNYDDIGYYLDKIKEFGDKDWQERIFAEGRVFKDKNEFHEYVFKIIKMFDGMKQEYVKLITEFINKFIFTLQYQEVAEETFRHDLNMAKAYLEGKDPSLMGMIHNLDLSKLPRENLSDESLKLIQNLEKIKLKDTIYNPYAEEIRKELKEVKKINKDITNSKKEERLPLYQRALVLMVKSQKEKINYNKKQSMAAAHKELKGINLHLYEEIDLNFENICKTYNNWLKETFPSGEYGLDELDETLYLSFYKDYDEIKIQNFFDHRIKRKKLTF
ncbi:MAG: hypothetical protein ACYDEE_17145 [Ignavibacteriaceae bacterium]